MHVKYLVCIILLPLLLVLLSSTAFAQSAETSSGNSMFSFAVGLHGIGTGGNVSPIRTQRILVIDVYNNQNQLIVSRVGKVMYNPTKGLFEGSVSIGLLQPGPYAVKVKTSSYLQKTVPGIVTIRQGGGSYQVQQVTLTAGDITEDNQTNVLDFNALVGCYSDLEAAKKCNPTVRDLADLNDDGKVNQYDYNLFLRELSIRTGA